MKEQQQLQRQKVKEYINNKIMQQNRKNQAKLKLKLEVRKKQLQQLQFSTQSQNQQAKKNNFAMIPTIPKSKFANLNKFNYHSRPLQSLSLLEKVFNRPQNNQSPNKIQNSNPQLLSLQISEHGKSGVFFIETQEGSLVLKCCHETAQDYFAFCFATMMEINTPEVQIVSCGEKIFHDIVYSIESFCEKDGSLLQRVKSRLDFPFYQIMEYIPSISLTNMGSQKFKYYIDQSSKNMVDFPYSSSGNEQKSHNQNQSVSLIAMSNQKLYEIGKCLGFDILINNADRFRFLWSSQGNVNNILIKVDVQTKQELELLKDRKMYKDNKNLRSLKDLIFIDHAPCLPDLNNIIAKNNVQKYLEKVSAFHLENIAFLRRQTDDLPNVYSRLDQQFQFFCQYRFNLDEKIMIAEGVIYITSSFIRNYKEGNIKTMYKAIFRETDNKKLENLFKREQGFCQISTSEMAYWNAFWNQELQKINISFLELMYIKLESIYSTYPQLIDQINKKVQSCLQQKRKIDQRLKSKVISKPPSQNHYKSDPRDEGSELDAFDKEADVFDAIEQQKFKSKAQSNAQKQNQRTRKWREKLQAFKTFNYMEKQA